MDLWPENAQTQIVEGFSTCRPDFYFVSFPNGETMPTTVRYVWALSSCSMLESEAWKHDFQLGQFWMFNKLWFVTVFSQLKQRLYNVSISALNLVIYFTDDIVSILAKFLSRSFLCLLKLNCSLIHSVQSVSFSKYILGCFIKPPATLFVAGHVSCCYTFYRRRWSSRKDLIKRENST